MRVLILACVVIAIFLATATSWSESETTQSERAEGSSTAPAEFEPITGTPVAPLPGSEQPMKDPFQPYSVGGPEAVWSYETLTMDEKAVADRGLNEDDSAVQNGYAAAAHTLAARAKSESAAVQLGTDNLGEIGVVP